MSAICNSTIQQIKKDYPELKVADACPVCGLKIGLHQNSPEPTGMIRPYSSYQYQFFHIFYISSLSVYMNILALFIRALYCIPVMSVSSAVCPHP